MLMTGKLKGVNYYKGYKWLGPSNLVGHTERPGARFSEQRVKGAGGVATGRVSLVAINDAPFTLTNEGIGAR